MSAIQTRWDQQRLGRRHAPDPRDHVVTPGKLRALIRAAGDPPTRKLPWQIGPILNQGSTSECTVYAAAQQYQSAPKKHMMLEGAFLRSARPPVGESFTHIYNTAKDRDEWPGNNYDGTSERAVQMYLIELGYTKEFLFVYDEDMAREYLRTVGQLMDGTYWFSGMDRPNRHGYVEPTGFTRGGHEYVCRWYHGPKHYKYPDSYEYVNSWGRSWGVNGRFFMKADARRILMQQAGDCIIASETRIS